MQWSDLKKIDKAPDRGHLLIYTRQSVHFRNYIDKSELANEFKDADLLEVHLFDDEKEYRSIVTRSKRKRESQETNGIIETIADFPDSNPAEIYREDILLEGEHGKITVLNHISYNELGMAVVDNYRLKKGGA